MPLEKGHKINLGRKYSDSHRENISKSLKGKPRPFQAGEKHGMWKGKKLVNYTSIHSYLRQFKIGKCEFCKEVRKTHLALKKENNHERKIENYLELCPSCHGKYDDTPEKKEVRMRSLSKTHAHQNPVEPKPCKLCSKEFIPRRKSSMFCSTKCSAMGTPREIRKRDKITGRWLELNK